MRISEVCTKTGLTKKAIAYYERQNLINPRKKSNGYREYSKEDVKKLEEICVYRKLDISIKDIKNIMNSKNKKIIINKILKDRYEKEAEVKMQQIYLERILNHNFSEETIEMVDKELTNFEKGSGRFLKNEFLRAFPEGIGKYLAYHFSPYLNEPIDTKEKFKHGLR